ncbi:c-type cytochrome [Bradyrhizobium sp. ma5]|uniref:c-type cytochrome n=1 Tax=Bradyrhizobium sp. ma5 TaxID=3344828 RepID=UPI0035D5274F
MATLSAGLESIRIGAVAVAFAAIMFPTTGRADGPRPDVASLPVSVDATLEQVVLGDRIFHGEAANGTCFQCHGHDAKGTSNGNDLTVGSLIWGDSLAMIKKTIRNNIALAPGRDGDLTDGDVDAVAAYVWSLVHQDRMQSQSAAK